MIWIQEPDITKVKVQETVLDDEQYKELVDRFDYCKSNDDLEEANNLLDDVYELRQESILTDGEYGQGNLLFKKFRDDGYLDSLKELVDELESEELSLDEER